MLRKFFCFAALAMLAAPAQAGVYASALFTVSNMRVQRSSTAGGVYSNVGTGGLTLLTSTLTSVNTAILNGAQVQNSDVGVIVPPAILQPPPNAAQSFMTSGAEVAPPEDTFAITVPVPATTAFARADTRTTGSLLTAGGLGLESVAEIEAADNSLGESIGSSTGTATFRFTVAQAGWYRLQFDSAVQVLANSIAPPAGRIAAAEASLSTTVNGSGPTQGEPNLVSQSVTGTGDTGMITTLGSVTAPIQLLANIDYTLTIGQVTKVSLTAVPEPGTMLAFGGILIAGGLGLRRRKK